MAIVAFLVLHFFLPLILVLFLYGHMFIHLRRSSKSGNDSISRNRSDLMQKAKNNVFKTTFDDMLHYFLCFQQRYITLITQGVYDSLSGE